MMTTLELSRLRLLLEEFNNTGRFDHASGVAAAIEVLRLGEQNSQPVKPRGMRENLHDWSPRTIFETEDAQDGRR